MPVLVNLKFKLFNALTYIEYFKIMFTDYEPCILFFKGVFSRGLGRSRAFTESVQRMY